LVGIFGNFINRVAVLIHKYYDGVIPAGNENAEELSEISKTAKEINEYLSKYEFRNALSALMNLARFGNQYFKPKNLGKPLKTILKKQQILFL
jgi:methionyl-tRNA synthetase